MLKEILPDDITIELLDEWFTQNQRLLVIYSLITKADPDNPRWEYAAAVDFSMANINYNLQGHGIGSNITEIQSVKLLVGAILKDNERFNDGKGLHVYL